VNNFPAAHLQIVEFPPSSFGTKNLALVGTRDCNPIATIGLPLMGKLPRRRID
jgi:hypothetical protein